MRDDRRKNRAEILAMLGLIGQIGIVMIASILIATFIAIYIGDRTGMRWLSVVGFFVGAIAGVQGVYRMVARYLKNKDDTRTSETK